MKKRIAVALVALVMIVGCVVGGTLAWLVDDTDAVVNTFTYGDINIDLWEHPINADGLTLNTSAAVVKSEDDFKMIPGGTIQKDPTVEVKPGSEACWIFVEVEESANFDDFMTYAIDGGWTLYGETTAGGIVTDNTTADKYVIYRAQTATIGATASVEHSVLSNDQVLVKGSVTKEMFNAFDDNKDGILSEEEKKDLPTLTFTACAVQSANITLAEAYTNASNAFNSK